jgi:phosphate acetyltransferase
MAVIDTIKVRAAEKCPTIVFPEGGEEKIALAATELAKAGICKPVIIGDAAQVAGFGADLNLVKVVAASEYDGKLDEWAEGLEILADLPARMVRKRLAKKTVNLAAALVHYGLADAMVAGLTYSTGDVIMASNMFIGLAEDVKIPSSYFLMEVPNWQGGEDGLVVFADCGVNPNPSAEQLADIAVTTSKSVEKLLGWEPRVAMLSFSTKGSGKHDDVTKVREATALAKELDPDLKVDGELQADAAIVHEVGLKKAGESPVAGKANVLIFPDLDAGNIAYKLVQRMTGGNAYGPMLQGFARPVSDLSRGSTVEDIVGVASIVAAQI